MQTNHKIITGIVLLTLAIIAGGTWLSSKKGTENREKLSKAMLGEKMPDLGAAHISRSETRGEYSSNPPTSGPHWAGVAGPGIKTEFVPDELVLHSMENGAADVWDREGLEQSEIEKIREAFISADGKKIR